jgi:hypothetical protein
MKARPALRIPYNLRCYRFPVNSRVPTLATAGVAGTTGLLPFFPSAEPLAGGRSASRRPLRSGR